MLMEDPFAARSTPEAGEARTAWEAGYTDTSAPVSIRNGRCKRRQNKERDPEAGTVLTEERLPEGTGVIGLRLARFPRTDG